MKKDLVTIQFHGHVFRGLKELHKLAVNSVSEAINAINTMTDGKLFRTLLDNDKKGIKYRVLINGRDFESVEKVDINNPRSIAESELVMKFNDLKTIDFVPVIEAADSDVFAIVIGAVLVAAGAVMLFTGVGAAFGVPLIMGGIGLIAAGVINLLSPPPQFEDFREIGGGGRASYLFNGPQNTTREGGPVPVGYGRLLVGSHTISASYEVGYTSAKETITT